MPIDPIRRPKGEEEEDRRAALVAGLQAGERALAAANADRGRCGVVARMVLLRGLMSHGVMGKACREAGLTVAQVRELRERDPVFDSQVIEATTCPVDEVEAVLVEKALNGDMKAIERVLKAKRPGEYRDRHEVAVVADAVIEVNLVPTGDLKY
jgi:hypothetical protein